MHSSTSSSKATKPAHWLASWVLSLLLAASLLGVWEWWLRSQGHQPSASDSKALWAWNRSAAVSSDRIIALLGTSRMLLGVSPQTIKQLYPDYGVFQLAINGQYPMSSLRNLADDEDFNGIAVVSVMAQGLESRYLDMQQGHVDFYQGDRSLDKQFNAYAKARIGYSFTFLRPELGLKAILRAWQKDGALPKPFHVRYLPDRSILANFSLTDARNLRRHLSVEKRRDYLKNPATEAAAWLANLAKVEAWVQRIQARGGQVVFVRFPTQGEHWSLDRKTYPRNAYWQPFADSSSAVTIHFQDVPEMAAFQLPDGSHLDQKDTATFTQILFGHIASRLPALASCRATAGGDGPSLCRQPE